MQECQRSMTSLAVVAVLVLFQQYCSASVELVRLRGSEYISYDPPTEIRAERNRISFDFKTFHPSGLILYGSGSQGDFVKIELIDGRLRLSLAVDVTAEHSVLLGKNLSDNSWHSVRVTRRQLQLNVALDTTTNSSTIPGPFFLLNLDSFIYVGGVDRRSSGEYHGADSVPRFVGCLREVEFDTIELIHGARIAEPHFAQHGSLEFSCPKMNYVPVNFPSPSARLVLTDESLKDFEFHLSFRSYHGEGVLMSRDTTNARVKAGLSAGKLQLGVDIGSAAPLELAVGENLHDGHWHDVTAGVNNREMWLQLDDRPEVRHSNPNLANIGNYWSALHVAYDTMKPGFVGCMYNISINGAAVDLQKLAPSENIGAEVNRCTISNRCFPDPCLNGGKCLQTWKEYRCDCSGTFYMGPNCKVPLYRATCEQYRRLGVSQDAYCKVDPDDVGPLEAFEVFCNMSTVGSAATVIKHKKPKRQSVTLGAVETNNHYFQQIEYEDGLKRIQAVIERSANCRQFVSFECLGSGLLNAPGGIADVQWAGRGGVTQRNWGGVPTGVAKCACGLTDNCVDVTKICNCDVKDDKWHEDSGYLTDKTVLPVTSLQFTKTAARSYFTVGPLECFGSARSTSKPVSRSSYISSTCRAVNPPTTSTEPTTAVQTASTSIPTTPNRQKSSGSAPTKRAGVTVATDTVTRNNPSTVTRSAESPAASDGSNVTATPEEAVTRHEHGVTVYRNGTVEHITRVKAWNYDVKFIILVSTSILAFFSLIAVAVIIHLRRTGRSRGFRCCAACWAGRKKRNIPDIQVYRHSIHSESPDVLPLDDMHNHSGAMEFEGYSMNGQALCHTLHPPVKKYVSFSSSSPKL